MLAIIEAARPFGRQPQHEADNDPGGIRAQCVVGEERGRVFRHDAPHDVRGQRQIRAPAKDQCCTDQPSHESNLLAVSSPVF